MDYKAENRKRELWFTDGTNAYYFPLGWGDQIVDPDAEEPELYGYVPVSASPDSSVDTLFMSETLLRELREVSETEALDLHPRLRDTLERINKGQ
jgi:hypothetical protein